MIFKTERKKAEKEFHSIKLSVQSSLQNYRIIRESPFGAIFEVKKHFLKDYSPSLDDFSTKIEPDFSAPSFNSTLSESPTGTKASKLSPTSLDQNNDSGYVIETNTFETTKCELVKTLLLENSNFKNELEAKEAMIFKLHAKVNSLEDQNKNLKSEKTTKNGQLKEKNKTIEGHKAKYDIIFKEKEIQGEILKNKIETFKKKNDSLSKENEKKKVELKNEKAKVELLKSKSNQSSQEKEKKNSH